MKRTLTLSLLLLSALPAFAQPQPIRIISEDLNGLEWDSTYQQQLSYNADQTLADRTIQQYYSNGWETVNRSEYFYTAGVQTQELNSQLNLSEWEETGRTLYTYTVTGKIEAMETQDAEGSDWTPEYRNFYTYDGQDRISELLFSDWDIANAGWDNVIKDTYTYSSGTNPDYIISSEWNGSAWVATSRYVFTYTSEGLIATVITDVMDADWLHSAREVYTYNADETMQQTHYSQWDAGISGWIENRIIDYTYNPDATVHHYVISQPNDSGMGWDEMYRTTYIYPEILGTKEEITAAFALFPNPAADHLTIAFAGEPAAIEVTDLNGVTLNVHPENGKQHTFSVNELPAGMYLVKIAGTSGTSTQRFVKL